MLPRMHYLRELLFSVLPTNYGFQRNSLTLTENQI